MRRAVAGVCAVGAATVAGMAWWRRHPRFGSGFVNRVVDPWLVGRGIVHVSNGEIGLLEHVGRRSGIVRVSPVHPVATTEGYRIVVPLGVESQWAQNVITQGHCRMQIGDVVHELDEPRLVAPSAIAAVPRLVAGVMDWLGFRYLVLHRYAEHADSLAMPPEPVLSGEPAAVAR